jgi:hypothetical protein
MDGDDVRKLEEVCQRALAKAMSRQLGGTPPERVCHLTAKAAMAVLEAVAGED